MASPIITVRNSDDSQSISTLALGTVSPGSESAEFTVRIWNNYGGAGPVDDAENCAIGVKTYLGLNTGDTNANGQEIVSEDMVEAKCTTRGDTSFTPIGGDTMLSIGNGVGSTTLSGSITTPADQVATVVIKINVPADAQAAAATYQLVIQRS